MRDIEMIKIIVGFLLFNFVLISIYYEET